ncbi:YfhO family protein [Pantoea sp. Z09]|uniref:YfhO family protein n=1 Tax=Pantoea sp. Z09 TaxID=2886821 RepID=UPI001EFE6434|nr:YfhO family protein [Pantoea sp. Z09]
MSVMQKKDIRAVVLLTALFISLCVIFDKQLHTAFGFLIGSRFDGLIETSILQHWYNVFAGHSKWDQVGYFYPYSDTLGYNDGYFIYGVIFSIYRLLGADVFLSSEFVNLTLKIIGFISFYYLSHNKLKLGFKASVCGAAIFTLSNALTMQMHHAQLLSIAFAPLMTILIYDYVDALCESSLKKSILKGSLAAVLLSAWLITTYYMAWFYILFFIMFVFCSLPLVFINFRVLKERVKKPSVLAILVPLVVLCVSIIPFLKVYLPKAKETGGQDLFSVTYYAPQIGNLLDPGKHNLLYGDLSDYIFSSYFPDVQRVGELNIGFPWLIALLLIISFFALIFNKNKDLKFSLLKCLVSSLFLSLIVMIKYNDFFLWEYIWRYIPGAKGMRVTSRYALFLIFPLSILAASFLSGYIVRLPKFLMFLIGGILLLEQVNLASSANLDRNSQLSFFKSIPAPPKNCKAFYVIGQRENEFDINNKNIDLSLYPHNVDAMLISEIFALRTINGFSTFNPKDWDFARDPLQSYRARIAHYLTKHEIESGMCELNLQTKLWATIGNVSEVGISQKIKDRIKLSLVSSPSFDENTKKWSVTVSLKNESDLNIGYGTFNVINIGIRLYDSENHLKNVDYLRVDMPYLHANGGENQVKFTLPEDFDKNSSIAILPVEEGINWFDQVGMHPLFVNFK